MNNLDNEFTLKVHPRPQEQISLTIPTDTLASLKKIAASRNLSDEALLKLYIGQGLRQDLAKQFGDRVLETTAQVLTKHLTSETEISAILQEIRREIS